MDNDNKEMFDTQLYGLLIRKKRIDMGYRKAEDFAKTVYRRTRVRITRDMLYKIERGKQVPDCVQFMALNIVLTGRPIPGEFIEICASNEWKALVKEESSTCIPFEWKLENAQEVRRENADVLSPDITVHCKEFDECAKDWPILFADESDRIVPKRVY